MRHYLWILLLVALKIGAQENSFPEAVKVVLQHEGGLSLNPNDRGLATNYGISLVYLRDFIKNHPEKLKDYDADNNKLIDSYDIRMLSSQSASGLYHMWWAANGYDRIQSRRIAIKLFDCAVNMGQKQAVKLLQSALDDVMKHTVIVPDGHLDTKTIVLLNGIYSSHLEEKLLNAYINRLDIFYTGLSVKNVGLKVFLRGWLRRASFEPK